MPFEELLTKLGIGSALAIVLFPLWKGDDFFSETFRDDVKDWLLNIRAPKNNFAVQISLGIFNKIFGSKLISLRSLMASAALTTFFSAWAVAWLTGSRFHMHLLSTHLPIIIACGYCSQVWTRMAMKLASQLKSSVCIFGILVVDYFVATLLATLPLLLVGFHTYLNALPSLIKASALLPIGLIFGHTHATSFLFDVTSAYWLPVVATWFSSLIYSAMVWGAFLGSLTAKLANRLNHLHSIATYILPIDKTPIRSIGISLLALSILSILSRSVLLELNLIPIFSPPGEDAIYVD